MNSLANVVICVPVGIWENYAGALWYATGPSTAQAKVFRTSVERGEWIEAGDALMSMISQDVHFRAPATGVIRSTWAWLNGRQSIEIQPLMGYKLPQNEGQYIFQELSMFVQEMIREADRIKNAGFLEKILRNFRENRFSGLGMAELVRRGFPGQDIFKFIDELDQAKCVIRELDPSDAT